MKSEKIRLKVKEILNYLEEGKERYKYKEEKKISKTKKEIRIVVLY